MTAIGLAPAPQPAPASIQEREVRARFDELQGRFRDSVASDDPRLSALLSALGPVGGLRVLDLGCGKGRFAGRLAGLGAEVVGLDLSGAMLAAASALSGRRVLGSARRLPFRGGAFDAVIAVEVLQHVGPGALDGVLAEARRVLAPGGVLAIIDRNAAALDPVRPWLPAVLVKRIDERRGLWMYPLGSPARERWFWPGQLERRLRDGFARVGVSRFPGPAESGRWPFRCLPIARGLALWTARTPEGGTA